MVNKIIIWLFVQMTTHFAIIYEIVTNFILKVIFSANFNFFSVAKICIKLVKIINYIAASLSFITLSCLTITHQRQAHHQYRIARQNHHMQTYFFKP